MNFIINEKGVPPAFGIFVCLYLFFKGESENLVIKDYSNIDEKKSKRKVVDQTVEEYLA